VPVKVPSQDAGEEAISSLLDEVLSPPVKKPQGAAPLAVEQAQRPAEASPTPSRRRRKRWGASDGMRLALCVPFFILFVVSLLATALLAAVALFGSSAAALEEGWGPLAASAGKGTAGVVVLIGLPISTFFYWLGESIRLGKLATFSDIFAPDAFDD
jgi:hypothetical protein